MDELIEYLRVHQTLSLISRNESRLWTPLVVDQGRAHPFKVNLEAERQVRPARARLRQRF